MKTMRSRPVYLSVCILVVYLALPVAASAQGQIQVTENQARVNFPYNVLFTARIQSDAAIEQVQLIYTTDARSCLTHSMRVNVELTQENKPLARWTWVPSQVLPPGAAVQWQWDVRDSAGRQLVTPVQSLVVEDPHYPWKTLQSAQVSLHWGAGDAAFGSFMLQAAQRGLDSLAGGMGIPGPARVQIWVYPSSRELRAAVPALPGWAGGVALPEYSMILMGGSSTSADSQVMVTHELAHLVVDQRIDNCYGSRLPAWLSEGLATLAEGPTSDKDRKLVMGALKQGSGLALYNLSEGFPSDSKQAELAYAQSGMMAAFLLEHYGAQRLDDLLEQVKQGSPINAALLNVYQLDTSGIEQAWHASLGFGSSPQPISQTPTPRGQRTPVPTLALYALPSATPPPAATLPPSKTSTAASLATFTPTALPPTATALPQLTAALPVTGSPPIGWPWLAGSGLALGVVFLFLGFKLGKPS